MMTASSRQLNTGPAYASRRFAPLVEEWLLPIYRPDQRKLSVSGAGVRPNGGMVPVTQGYWSSVVKNGTEPKLGFASQHHGETALSLN